MFPAVGADFRSAACRRIAGTTRDASLRSRSPVAVASSETLINDTGLLAREQGRRVLRDRQPKGVGIRVDPDRAVVFIVQYRMKPKGAKTRTRSIDRYGSPRAPDMADQRDPTIVIRKLFPKHALTLPDWSSPGSKEMPRDDGNGLMVGIFTGAGDYVKHEASGYIADKMTGPKLWSVEKGQAGGSGFVLAGSIAFGGLGALKAGLDAETATARATRLGMEGEQAVGLFGPKADKRIPAVGRIYDATIGFKAHDDIRNVRFGRYSGGDRINVVWPSLPVGYSISP